MTSEAKVATVNPENLQGKKFTELSLEELILVSEGSVPTAILTSLSWEGLETRKDFSKIFVHRANPAMIAKTLLKDREKEPAAIRREQKAQARAQRSQETEEQRIERERTKALRAANTVRPKESEEDRKVRLERLRIRELEAQAKLQRTTTQTEMNQNIISKLRTVESGQTLFIARLEEVVTRLDELQTTLEGMIPSTQTKE